MADKLLDDMTVKLTVEQKRQLVALADADGTTASELVRMLIASHICERERHFRALASVFGQSGQSFKG